jgi:hypothetical protein
MGKQRFILLMAALAVLLCACEKKASASRERSVEAPTFFSDPEAAVAFPCALADGLVAEKMITYDGPFWEDGSGEAVSGVAGLMLSNTGSRMIEFGAITVEQGGRMLHFFVYDLPPGSRCLVAEWQRQSFSEEVPQGCRVGILRWGYQELSREEVNYVGTDEVLTVVNRTTKTQSILVRYKCYDKEGDYFLGGMAFSAHFFGAEPQTPKTLAPEHYHAGKARVVSVSTEE